MLANAAVASPGREEFPTNGTGGGGGLTRAAGDGANPPDQGEEHGRQEPGEEPPRVGDVALGEGTARYPQRPAVGGEADKEIAPFVGRGEVRRDKGAVEEELREMVVELIDKRGYHLLEGAVGSRVPHRGMGDGEGVEQQQ